MWLTALYQNNWQLLLGFIIDRREEGPGKLLLTKHIEVKKWIRVKSSYTKTCLRIAAWPRCMTSWFWRAGQWSLVCVLLFGPGPHNKKKTNSRSITGKESKCGATNVDLTIKRAYASSVLALLGLFEESCACLWKLTKVWIFTQIKQENVSNMTKWKQNLKVGKVIGLKHKQRNESLMTWAHKEKIPSCSGTLRDLPTHCGLRALRRGPKIDPSRRGSFEQHKQNAKFSHSGSKIMKRVWYQCKTTITIFGANQKMVR